MTETDITKGQALRSARVLGKETAEDGDWRGAGIGISTQKEASDAAHQVTEGYANALPSRIESELEGLAASHDVEVGVLEENFRVGFYEHVLAYIVEVAEVDV